MLHVDRPAGQGKTMQHDRRKELPSTLPGWYTTVADSAAYVFFCMLGLATGATVAVFWKLVDLSGDQANLLGGILGAGLGAAGGVFGSFLLFDRQERNRRGRQRTAILGEIKDVIDVTGALIRALGASSDVVRVKVMYATLVSAVECVNLPVGDVGPFLGTELRIVRLHINTYREWIAGLPRKSDDAAHNLVEDQLKAREFLMHESLALARIVVSAEQRT